MSYGPVICGKPVTAPADAPTAVFDADRIHRRGAGFPQDAVESTVFVRQIGGEGYWKFASSVSIRRLNSASACRMPSIF